MDVSDIIIKGAREHNLRDVDVTLPRNQLICLTGVSGSGKSSLAFDTLYAEGQRRYIESLSSFARQFLGQMPKPEVDHISGLSPSISISQKTAGQNPRSTVGTITEIYDYLRVLFARVGKGHCPKCGELLTGQSREQIIDRILRLPAGSKFMVLAPLIRGQKGEYRDLFEDLLRQGFIRARANGQVVRLTDDLQLDRQMRHDIEVVVDRLVVGPDVRPRLAEAVDLGLKLGEGDLIVLVEGKSEKDRQELRLSSRYACIPCGQSYEPPSPQLFSFNSPQGMCLSCHGLGRVYNFDPELLITDPGKSFKKGCMEIIGPWRDLGRWRRHIYQSVADTLEYQYDLEAGSILETPWEELEPEWQEMLLYGTGDLHVTYTWRSRRRVEKYGGTFEGIIPQMLSKYRGARNRMYRRWLERFMNVRDCASCEGRRLNPQACSVTVASTHKKFRGQAARSLPGVCNLSIGDAALFFSELELSGTEQFIAEEALKEIRGRLGFLLNVGLDYLTLDRTAPTLSGGEAQRIRLAGQVGCGLVGVTYILDEPSIGLHPRDNDRLLQTLGHLRDMGNTVVVVEHDEDTMRAADRIIDFGPGPGIRGGEVVADGTLDKVIKTKNSVTGQYLAGRRKIAVPSERRQPSKQRLKIQGAEHNNLKNIDVEIPLGMFVCVTGVSGSGKSSLVVDVMGEALRRDLNGASGEPGKHKKITGLKHVDKLIAIDQSPIGRTPRSNPATYIKVFDDIRSLYTKLPDSRARGYKPGRFSFNVSGGRCEACEGNGSNKLEMDFLADIWITCPVCEGHRFNRETLQVKFKGKSISDVLEMDVQQALEHFRNITPVETKLQTLHDVGLDYLKLGQPSPTLSGGEAQRIKLARELVKRSTGQTIYLLDEPTTGLHFADIEKLLEVLHGFVAAGNTVIVIEHNVDVIKTADWIIDLGPEGGEEGGEIVAAGPPEEIVRTKASFTGKALKPVLKKRAAKKHKSNGSNGRPVARRRRGAKGLQTIDVRGAAQHNLKQIDVQIPREQITVCCGLSGSGKSSLAMDTIYAEGQRRYIESLSAYARQFVAQMQKPKLEHISGLSPAIAIEQKNLANTPRSTVGTVTEIYDYLRVLFARLGTPYCPACDVPIGTQSMDEIIDQIAGLPPGSRLYLMAPVQINVGEKYETLWEEVHKQGYLRIRVDGKTYELDNPPEIDRRRKHLVEVVIDRVVVRAQNRSRIADTVETALALGRGVMHVAFADKEISEEKWRTEAYSQHLACRECGRSFEPLSPHNFSFNSYLGWCPSCEGLGTQTGANPAALLHDPKLTLAEGAVALWPNVSRPLFKAMLKALHEQTGIPVDVPFDALSGKWRRLVMHGTGEEWISVWPKGRRTKKTKPLFRFQYKGLYPALAEASRLAPGFRGKFDAIIDEVDCSVCNGSRLRDDAAAVRFGQKTIDDVCRLSLADALAFVEDLKLDKRDEKIAGEVLKEIRSRLRFLVEVGLDYLNLRRSAPTLSGGEAQRIRLASQIGSGLTGVLYVLDEPTIGLHPRDNARLIAALQNLRDLGNTLLLVEHDREVISAADRLLDFGPAAGEAGGRIIADGSPKQIAKRKKSVTGPFLSGKRAIPVPSNRRMTPDTDQPPGEGWLEIQGARHNNLRNVDVQLPLGTFTAITGVSGSGKSSLIEDVLYKALARQLHRARTIPGAHRGIAGVERINKVIRVDQQPLGNSPTSTPATYTGVFDQVRELFAQLPTSKLRGYTPRRFSFNAAGGRCEECGGSGQNLIEMHFLPDVWVECETCRGKRYNPETLEVEFRGKNISDVLEMPCGKALELFENIPKIRRVLQTLCDVGLDYLRLGQPAPTLSGGEAQRVKLAAELGRPDTGRTLYLLDEPTTGLHFEDLRKLLDVLHRLVDLGNTVAVIEHNLDVVKSADWIIDLGPEAGDAGGYVVTCGTPEQVVEYSRKVTASKNGQRKADRCYTGEALAPVLEQGPYQERKVYDFKAELEKREGDLSIKDVGRDVKMPWQQDGRRWHTQDRLAQNGEPCQWEGEVLNRVIDRIQELGEFGQTNWNHRTIVEIAAPVKSHGWFFHAHTGREWLVVLKFRVKRNTFKADRLQERIGLLPLNDLPELPVYGSGSRVKCKNLRGPWQEVKLMVHSLEEIDHEEFWSFLEEAVRSFDKLTNLRQQNPEDLMPWKVLGKKWHLSRKGFPPGKPVHWEPQVLEKLVEILEDVAPEADYDWQNQKIVHVKLPEENQPWATLSTKQRDALQLTLTSPKGKFALGRIAELARSRELVADKEQHDLVKLKFRKSGDLNRGDLLRFLQEHLDASR